MRKAMCIFLHIANSDKPIKLYNKSVRGTRLRQLADKILKEYLLRAYSINQRLLHMENRIDHRLSEHDNQIKELSGNIKHRLYLYWHSLCIEVIFYLER